jgi:hypothetical protein
MLLRNASQALKIAFEAFLRDIKRLSRASQGIPNSVART